MNYLPLSAQPRHRLAKRRIAMLFALPALITCASILTLIWHTPLQVSVLGIVIAGLAWRIFLDIPFEFAYCADDSVLFRSIRKTQTIPLHQIRHSTRFGSRGYLKLRHGNGTLFLPESIDGAQELLRRINIATQAGNNS